MFSQTCVIHPVHGGGVPGAGVTGRVMCPRVCDKGCVPGGAPCDLSHNAFDVKRSNAGGMHPTGMFSCYEIINTGTVILVCICLYPTQ